MQSVCVVSATMTHHLPRAKILHSALLSHTYKYAQKNKKNTDTLSSMHRKKTKTTKKKHPFPLRVFEHVDACEDLQCRSQFNVHGAHEVVLL